MLAAVVTLVAVVGGGVAAAAPPPRPSFAPMMLMRQLPSGEVLLLDPQEMRLSRWGGGAIEEIATFRPAPCPPHTFAWDPARQRLAVLCPFRLEGRVVRDQELYLVQPGRQPRSLRPPPLAFTWAFEYREGELHAAGVPCPPGPCTRSGADTERWRKEHLAAPQPAWWRLAEATRRWTPVRAVEPFSGWRALLPEGSRRDSMLDTLVMLAVFDVSPALFATTVSGRQWYFTATGPHLELLSPEGEVVARHPSPVPPPGTKTVGWPQRNRQREVPVRRFLGVTVVEETLYLLVDAEQGQELLRLTPAGELTRQALPRGKGCDDRRLSTSAPPWPCALVVREGTVVTSPPWQEHPLGEEMHPPAP